MKTINLINDGVHTLRQVIDKHEDSARLSLIVPRDWINREIRKARASGWTIRECEPVNLIAGYVMYVGNGGPGRWFAELPTRKIYNVKTVIVERSFDGETWTDYDFERRRLKNRRYLVFQQYGGYDV